LNLRELFDQIKWIPSISVTFIDALQILILTLVIYYFTKSLYKTRAWIWVKGLMIIGAIYVAICLADMVVLQTIMQGLFSTLMIAIIIMLQPELQRIVELIGKRRLVDIKALLSKKTTNSAWYSERTIQEIADACEKMSAVKTGALLVIERDIPLTDCIDSGIKLNSMVSNQLLINIFEKNTPLHDGAVVVSHDNVASATCYLPLSSNPNIDKRLGTRHRAAIGISENSDCIVVVVSEETGAISFCVDGVIQHDINRSELIQLLKANMKNDERLVEHTKSNSPLWMKILAPALGVIIWMTVIFNMDPITIKYINDIPVNAINTEVFDELGQAYTITSGQTVSVRVRGPRSLVDNMTAEHLIADADFEKMSIVYAVPVEVSPIEGYEVVEIIDKRPVMQLSIEEMTQVAVKIEVQITGDNNNDIVVITDVMETKEILVTCPESIATTLDKAVVIIDANDKTHDFIATSSPTLYDNNGNIVSGSNVSLAQESVTVTMRVYDVKEIPIIIELVEQNFDGNTYYVLNGSTPEFDSLRIAADGNKMMELKEIVITIDPRNMNVNADSILIDVTQFLPEGCYLAKDQNDKMSVKLDLTKYKKMNMKLSASDINITGYDADKHMVSIQQVQAVIELYYNADLVDPNTITLTTLNPTLKIIEAIPGQYEGVLTLTGMDGVTIAQELIVKYVISEKPSAKGE
jgi:diadenylate cyclase